MKQLMALLLISVASARCLGEELEGTWVVLPDSQQGVAQWQLFTFSKRGNQTSGTISSLPTLEKDVILRRIKLQGNEVYLEAGDGNRWKGNLSDNNDLHLTWTDDAGRWLPQEMHLMRLAADELRTLKTQVLTDRAQLVPLSTPPLHDVPPNGLATTPVMGWNSWNHFSAAVDDKAIRSAADALVSTGLRDTGYIYVDIDDGWQGARDSNGELHSNEKFPDMKALADYVHSKGLKLGIYSSPGPFTCASHIGSHGYEVQDAKTFAAWGVDLLKYDWCSAGDLYGTLDEMRGRYQIMGEALQATGRPIVYSLCQYGLLNVGNWGRQVGGNLWRISTDSIIEVRGSPCVLNLELTAAHRLSMIESVLIRQRFPPT